MPPAMQQCTGYTLGIQNLPHGLVAQRAMMVMACALGSMAVIGAIASTDAVNAGKLRTASKSLKITF